MSTPLLRVEDLKMHFEIPSSGFFAKNQVLKAVDGVSFELNAGETLGVVGESGCGKSTLAKAVLQLLTPTSGTVELAGQSLTTLNKLQLREQRKIMQIIFQDPLAALNPRMTLSQIIGEPLTVFEKNLSKKEIASRVKDIMAKVGLAENLINRYPHEFSGGQCQRIGIARALILNPRLIVCDEPVSALDVSIRAQIVNLLMELQKELDLALIFIAHDLHIVRHISDKVMVMYLGKAVEIAESQTLYKNPVHPYTQALIDSVPELDPKLNRQKQQDFLEGDLPSPLNPPSGCAFRTRCKKAQAHCSEAAPELAPWGKNTEESRLVACFEV
ncbi:murein tripeptide/oligopeptide ABC transporter ATP binding protein OppF [Aurantivibrio infirmus]